MFKIELGICRNIFLTLQTKERIFAVNLDNPYNCRILKIKYGKRFQKICD